MDKYLIQVNNNDTSTKFIDATFVFFGLSQPLITCSKLTIETLEQGVKYV